MATLPEIKISSWNLVPLNPDGTDNVIYPSITSATVPPASGVDWAAMGQRFRLELYCDLANSYPDTSSVGLPNSTLRYLPGMFVEPFATYFAPGSLPPVGYTIQIGATATPGTYPMPLLGPSDLLNSNQNGRVEIIIATDTSFRINHYFRMVSDTEGYTMSRLLENRFKLTKSSQLSSTELTEDRPSVYGFDRALNCYLAIQNVGQSPLSAFELSIPWSASFNDWAADGTDTTIPSELTIERVSNPGVEVPDLSAWEDNQIIVTITDAGVDVVPDEIFVIVTKRNLTGNVGGYERDLGLTEAKMVTLGTSTQVAGMIYGPVSYLQAGGFTTLRFVMKGSLLQPATNYDLHIVTPYELSAVNTGQHAVFTNLQTLGPPLAFDFGIASEIWSRNGNKGENYLARVNERLTAVMAINEAEYDAAAGDPLLDFEHDVKKVTVRIYNPDESDYDEYYIERNLVTNAWFNTQTGHVGHQKIGVVNYFYLKEFRVPYQNNQGLEDWNGTTRRIEWIFDSVSLSHGTNFGITWKISSELTIDGYENDEPSPVITNIRFLNPETGLSDICGVDIIRVVADVADLGATTYCCAMVDKFPLGVTLFNDNALEEEDVIIHTLPPYVIFEELQSALISDVPISPEDGIISFDVDVSSVPAGEKIRIFIITYRA